MSYAESRVHTSREGMSAFVVTCLVNAKAWLLLHPSREGCTHDADAAHNPMNSSGPFTHAFIAYIYIV